MDLRLRTEVAQLSIVAGTHQDGASNMGIVQKSPVIPAGAGKGNLYVLVDVTGDPAEKHEVCRDLVEIISYEYFRVPGGITNGLRQAVRAANALLYERNAGSLPLWRKTGEASCVVLRGHDLYVGLAGGAVVYVVQGQELRVFPRPSALRATGALSDQQPAIPRLGVENVLAEVGLFHCRLEAADIILMASSPLPQLVTRREVIGAAQGGLGALTHTLASAASVADLSALAIQTVHEAVESVPVKQPVIAKATAVDRRRQAPPKIQVPARERTTPRSGRGVGTRLELIVAFFGGLGARLRRFLSWLVTSGVFGAIGRGLKAVFLGIVRALGGLGRQMLPEREPVPQPMEAAYVRRGRTVSSRRGDRLLPVMGALSIVFIVAAIAAGLALRARSSAAQFNQMLSEAQVETEIALNASAPAEVREHLAKAQGLLDQATRVRPSDPEAVALQKKVLSALDEINEVVRLQFSAYVPFEDPARHPRRVVAGDEGVYVLDVGTQQLYNYTVDEMGGFAEPPGGAVLLRQQDQVGSVLLQEMDDLVWMEAGNGRESSDLLVLVNGESILQFDGSRGFTPVSVADTIIWKTPRLIEGYFGYLYVLDSEQDRILKYTPTGSSYDTSPADYLQAGGAVELDSAVDMAINGYVYVLLADGRILKFEGGTEQAFSIGGMDDQPLQNPTAIFATPETDHIYVVDAGNERIVQLDKEGVFVRQFRASGNGVGSLEGLQDVCVREAEGQLLVLSTDRLLIAAIPELPQVE